MKLRLKDDHLTFGRAGKVFEEKGVASYFDRPLFERLNERNHGYNYSVKVKQEDGDNERIEGNYLYETEAEVINLMEWVTKTRNDNLQAMLRNSVDKLPIFIECHKGVFQFAIQTVKFKD